MNRKKWLALLAVCLICLIPVLSGYTGRGKGAVPEHVFRYAENQAADFPTTLGANRFAELVWERTGGRIQIVVYHDAQLGSEVEVVEQLRFGGVDFARLSLSQLAEVSPSLGVLQLPYLYRDEAHMWRVLDGEIGGAFLGVLGGENIVGLSWYNAGARSFYTTTPVRAPEDLRGLRIRIQESTMMASMVRLLGATPVPIVYSEVYSSLKTGLVDGAENNWPSYESTAHHEIARYFYQDQHARVPEMQVISAAAAQKLSSEDMRIVRECARESALFQRKEWALRENRSEEACKAQGVEVVVPGAEDSLRLEELCRPLYEQYAADYSGVLERIAALRGE